MTKICYDGVNPATVPAGGDLYAGYVNGAWPSWNALHQAHPNAIMVSIDVNGSAPWAQVADVENGDLTPAGFVQWQKARAALGVPLAEVTCYCNESTQPEVIAACNSAGTPTPLWWIAHPESPPAPFGDRQVARQWNFAGGYDQSIVADVWPWVIPTPPPPPPPPPPPSPPGRNIWWKPWRW